MLPFTDEIGKNDALPKLFLRKCSTNFFAVCSLSVTIFWRTPPRAISIAVWYLLSTEIKFAKTPSTPDLREEFLSQSNNKDLTLLKDQITFKEEEPNIKINKEKDNNKKVSLKDLPENIYHEIYEFHKMQFNNLLLAKKLKEQEIKRSYENTVSWKITKPVRAMKKIFKRH